MSAGDRAESPGSDDGDERDEHEERDERGEREEPDERVLNGVGCLLAVAGLLVAAVYAVPRAAYSYDGGFESQYTDWGVVFVDVPLILVAGFALPTLTWVAAARRLRPWPAAVVCLAVVALGLWGLDTAWHPKQGPDPGYGPGI
ncbi:hypothetical protein ACWFR1_11225 [Streptomyces sp. NPDC055103]